MARDSAVVSFLTVVEVSSFTGVSNAVVPAVVGFTAVVGFPVVVGFSAMAGVSPC